MTIDDYGYRLTASIGGKGANMTLTLEEIREWRETLLERITPITVIEHVDWLIAEVTKLQKLNSQQIDPYAQGQEDAARRCAEIIEQDAKFPQSYHKNFAFCVAQKIRSEFN
jgi:hypothetical protein